MTQRLVGKVRIIGVLKEHGRRNITFVWLKHTIDQVNVSIGALDHLGDLGHLGRWLGTVKGEGLAGVDSNFNANFFVITKSDVGFTISGRKLLVGGNVELKGISRDIAGDSRVNRGENSERSTRQGRVKTSSLDSSSELWAFILWTCKLLSKTRN